MAVNPEELGIHAIAVNTYLEAVGAIAAYKAGVSLDALQPHILPIHALPSALSKK